MKLYLLVILVFLSSCGVPTNTNNNLPEIELELKYNDNKKILDTLHVNLSWSEITIENFKEIQIKRLNVDSSLKDTANWIIIGATDNEFITSWQDIINDDALYTYRVEYYDINNNYKRAEADLQPLQTTHIDIPLEYNSIKLAVESPLIDDGDTVKVSSGIYETPSFSFGTREILLTKKENSGTPVIQWIETKDHNGNVLPDSSFIFMGNGTINGFVIKAGLAKFGGGILASGNSKIIRCGIFENTANYNDGGDGGGLYLSGNAQLLNSIVYSNNSSNLGEGVFIDQSAENVQIINCTIVDNSIYTESPNVLILNTILLNSSLPINPIPLVKYSYAGQQWHDLEATNILGNIQLADPLNEDFHTLPGSVGFDSGDPDPEFNDPDGTRNDLGAFGGPLGDWDIDYSDLE